MKFVALCGDDAGHFAANIGDDIVDGIQALFDQLRECVALSLAGGNMFIQRGVETL